MRDTAYPGLFPFSHIHGNIQPSRGDPQFFSATKMKLTGDVCERERIRDLFHTQSLHPVVALGIRVAQFACGWHLCRPAESQAMRKPRTV